MTKLPKRRKRKPQLGHNKFTRGTRKIIYEAFRARLPYKRACLLANIGESTFMEWMRMGKDPDNHPKHALFRKIVNKAKALKEKEALKCIEMAQQGGQEIMEYSIKIGGKYGREITRTRKILKPNWGAAAWWLEHTKPEDYAIDRNGESTQSPEDTAREIQQALAAMDESVPAEDCCLSEINSCD